MRTISQNPTRKQHSLDTRKKRTHRVAIIAGSFVAVAGLVTGGAFAATSAVAAQERVAATTALAESTGLDRSQLGAYNNIAEAHTDNAASIVLVKAKKVITATKGKVDASKLTEVTTSLASFETLPLNTVVSLTATTKAETASVETAAAKADRVAKAAVAAAKAAAAKAAAAKAAQTAKSLAGGNSVAGAKATAQAMASSKYGWGAGEFSCLDQLWMKESGWNYKAYNPSGATGIPQALPGDKMATAGADWATNATTQIAWGLEYISASSYGTPCAAWAHSEAHNWY
jgi:hypothetical protein